jgi:hypothetical protein
METLRHTFSEEELEEMGQIAQQLAEAGSGAIDDLTDRKVRLAMGSLRTLDEIADIRTRLQLAQALTHDVAVINEVLRQANAIRQFQGVDDLSELDRHAQEAGLGSVFDENSEIGKRLAEYLR